VKVVAPWSGGVDSTFMVVKLLEGGYEVHPIYVDFGTPATPCELEAMHRLTGMIRRIIRSGKLYDLKVFKVEGEIHSMIKDGVKPKLYLRDYDIVTSQGVPLSHFYFPARNLIILSVAVAYAESEGIDRVAFATSGSDQQSVKDLSIEFIAELNKLLAKISPVRIETPVVNYTREDEWLYLKELGLIDYTFSCQRPLPGCIPCKTCPHCIFDAKMRWWSNGKR